MLLPADEVPTLAQLQERAPTIYYGDSKCAWKNLADFIRAQIEAVGARSVCELGGGAKPLLSPAEYKATGVELTIADISPVELELADPAYHTIVADLGTPGSRVGEFDLVFSRMLAEHLPRGRDFHANVFEMLRPGGLAVHFFPTLWAIPFVVNRLIPETISQAAIKRLQPDRHLAHDQKKFPARYSWCFGPSPRQIRRFEELGFRVISYGGFFGTDYYDRIPLLSSIAKRLTAHRLAHPRPNRTAFALVVVERTTGRA
jgi:SAM-dependent methyltransferase